VTDDMEWLVIPADAGPSGFTERITAWLQENYPVKVLAVEVPPASAGETTVRIRVTADVGREMGESSGSQY
jgi:hypothetical protein